MRGVLIILFALFAGNLMGQTCCSGGVPLSNNLGVANEGSGILQIGINYDYNNLNTLFTETERLEDDSRKRATNSVLWNTSYNFSDRWSAEVLFSWVNQTREITQFGQTNSTETNGIGDIVFLGKYTLPNFLSVSQSLSLGAGIKAPVGRSDLTTEDGIQLTADLQPGTGAWDGIGYVTYSTQGFRPTAALTLAFLYRLTGKNDAYLNNTSTYEFGDVFQGIMGYTEEFLAGNILINPGIILKYRHAAQDKINELDFPNTGGEWFFLRPEVLVSLSPDIQLRSQYEFPLYSKVDGTQLIPTSRFTIGMLFQFKPRTTVTIPS